MVQPHLVLCLGKKRIRSSRLQSRFLWQRAPRFGGIISGTCLNVPPRHVSLDNKLHCISFMYISTMHEFESTWSSNEFRRWSVDKIQKGGMDCANEIPTTYLSSLHPTQPPMQHPQIPPPCATVCLLSTMTMCHLMKNANENSTQCPSNFTFSCPLSLRAPLKHPLSHLHAMHWTHQVLARN